MPRKVKLILNPVADMGHAWRVANDLRPILAEYGNADWSGTVYPTHATELARQAGEQGYDLVIAVGGDGTVHEVINGLMQVPAKKRPILGVVPVGSGNDFAHAAGIPIEPAAALRQALKGESRPIDLGLLEDETGRSEYFDNTLGIGFDTVVTLRSHKLPVIRGFLMYLVAVIQTIILNFDPAKLSIATEKENWEDPTLMLVLCNGPREGGGFLVAPEAKPDDGILHYASIRKVSRLMMFRLVPEVMKGTHGRFKPVRMGDCRKMAITSDRPLYIHLDGEIYTGFGSNVRGLSIEVVPEALRVVRDA
ncbi:MAG: diacylglycerol kinase family lipid kinase [Anaerolineales bacterium]|nr:diacylglycerol kinase family lipid kinase [Anaerolineales bacterium]MDP2975627.1 diacylglycerol kinase family lipid kinase [Anaerolineales bacterium]MDP3185933.1 diacylglycerol kinase family lipid kinase [Anaerolineales bacterium]